MGKGIFFSIPAMGHVNPTLGVVAELRRRGEQILYANNEEMRAVIESSGATFLPYPTSDRIESAWRRTRGGRLTDNALSLNRLAAELLPFAVKLIQREKPDFIIADSLAAWGKHAAHSIGRRCIASITSFVLTRGTPLPVTTGMKLELASHLFPTIPAFLEIWFKMRLLHGVNLGLPLDAMTSMADLNLVFTTADLQPGADHLDETFHFIGGSINARPSPADFPFDQLDRQPLIYISLGTINNENLDFYKACFAALSDYPAQVLLAAGKRTNLADLEPIPENFFVRNFVPQLQVLERADLFVTHGGMNSVHEGLWYGVPLIAIPQQLEQAVVATQVERTGAGVALATRPPYGKVTAPELRAAVEKVLADRATHQAASKRLGDSLRAAGGAARAADLILEFTASE